MREHAHVQGTVNAMGYRVPSSTARTFALRARSAPPPALAPTLTSVVDTIPHPSEQIAAADTSIGLSAREGYPETTRLRQIAGVGPITALCFVLTLEDPTRFADTLTAGAAGTPRAQPPGRGTAMPAVDLTDRPSDGSPTPVDLSRHLECGWKQVGERVRQPPLIGHIRQRRSQPQLPR